MSDLGENAPNSIYAGAPPDPAGGAYSAAPDPLAVFKGPTSKGMEGKRRRRERKGRKKEG